MDEENRQVWINIRRGADDAMTFERQPADRWPER